MSNPKHQREINHGRRSDCQCSIIAYSVGNYKDREQLKIAKIIKNCCCLSSLKEFL
jgi:hypothetical protein